MLHDIKLLKFFFCFLWKLVSATIIATFFISQLQDINSQLRVRIAIYKINIMSYKVRIARYKLAILTFFLANASLYHNSDIFLAIVSSYLAILTYFLKKSNSEGEKITWKITRIAGLCCQMNRERDILNEAELIISDGVVTNDWWWSDLLRWICEYDS